MTVPNREEDQQYSLEDAREMGVTLTKLRVGCSAHRWQLYIIPRKLIQWDKMGTHTPEEE